MIKIYSRIDDTILLHIVDYLEMHINSDYNRIDICPESEFIQCAFLKPDKDVKYRPHQHIWKDGEPSVIAQESWCVVRGKVKSYFYDTDGSLIDTYVIGEGDATFTFQGGHTYEILTDDTLIREYKTGPYTGVDNDKVFIQDNIND